MVSLLAMSGCATSEKIQPVQLGDHDLSCQQIQVEMTKLDESQVKVEGNKGVNGTNVAAAVAWLPGLAYTYYDASKATDAISARRSHLTEIFESKGCKMRKTDATAAPVPDKAQVGTKDQPQANNRAKPQAKVAQTKE